ncbi:type II secretion system protein, partial [bacterium]|nr:type II secretion system protein [bacterium]
MKKKAFTLAEVLITMAVIGVVAAVTVPALVINIQERVQNEQARSAKYKLTKATDKMKSLGLLDSRYSTANSTQDFVRELQKHLKLMKVCNNDHLTDCWPTASINLPAAVTGYETSVANLKTGDKLKAIAPKTKTATTMGIVTADGTPMILLYSQECS